MMHVCGDIQCPNQGTAQAWPCPRCQPPTRQSNTTQSPPPTGWICPVCHKGNAPHAMKCGHCAGVTVGQKPWTGLGTVTVGPPLTGDDLTKPPNT